ncbi:MAG: TIGR04141 family sporadically distributed protein [Rhodospirillales bacterium]|nr:TIGR04141 family sporadically distributed protein [Rhodospirillales bacterium]
MTKKTVDGQLQTSVYKMEDGKNLQELAKEVTEESYSEQQLNNSLPDDYNFQLFYNRYTYTPKWKSFIEPLAEKSQAILFTENSAQQNYVLFIETKDTKNIYAVTGGYGHNAIRKYIDNDFGLDVLSRLIKKEDKILKSARERNFVGGIPRCFWSGSRVSSPAWRPAKQRIAAASTRRT